MADGTQVLEQAVTDLGISLRRGKEELKPSINKEFIKKIKNYININTHIYIYQLAIQLHKIRSFFFYNCPRCIFIF